MNSKKGNFETYIQQVDMYHFDLTNILQIHTFLHIFVFTQS